MAAKDDPVVIKKYANRRLYNTGTSTYVTLEDLAEMVKRNEEFVVQDAKTGDDITHPVLTQIIFEEENKGGAQTLLPINVLRQLIRFYGDAMQGAMGAVLEQNLKAAAQMQAQLAKQALANPVASMQGLMGNYLEQSRSYFEKMQQQMGPAGALFPGFAPPKK